MDSNNDENWIAPYIQSLKPGVSICKELLGNLQTLQKVTSEERTKIIIDCLVKNAPEYFNKNTIRAVLLFDKYGIPIPYKIVVSIGSAMGLSFFNTYMKRKPVENILRPQITALNLESACKKLGIDSKNYFNFACIGHKSTGKTQFIKAMGQLSKMENNLDSPKMYDLSLVGLGNVRLFDFPGSGTEIGHSTIRDAMQQYFNKYGLVAFDFLLIFVEQSVGMDAIELAKIAMGHLVPTCFVRSKCDWDLVEPIYAKHMNGAGEEIAKLNQIDADELMEQFRPVFDNQFASNGQQNFPYFFISSTVLDRQMHTLRKEHERCPSCSKNSQFQFEEVALMNFMANKSAQFRNANASTIAGKTTPLHRVVQTKDLSSAIQLLAYGAQPDIQDDNGNTALHLAVMSNVLNIVRLLLCFGFSMDIANKENKRPRNLAKTSEMKQLFDQLSLRLEKNDEEMCDIDQMRKEVQKDSLKFQSNKGVEEKMKSMRLLSLDGGGIRGLVLIQILMYLEKKFGKPILQCFDWIAGTSTGAILALALAHGTPLIDCLRLYLRFKDEVFVGSRPYDAIVLETFLKEHFGKNELGQPTTMKNIKDKKILITATDGSCHPLKQILYRSYTFPGVTDTLNKPDQIPIWEAARASSAAPTYFKSFKNHIMDGGLMANNPVIDLLTDVQLYNSALRFQKAPSVDINCVVSIGTGRIPSIDIDSVDIELPKNLGLNLESIIQMKKVVDTALNLKEMLIEQVACSDGTVIERARSWAHSLNVPFFRFTPQLEKEIPLDIKEDEILVELMWNTKVYMETIAYHDVETLANFLMQ